MMIENQVLDCACFVLTMLIFMTMSALIFTALRHFRNSESADIHEEEDDDK